MKPFCILVLLLNSFLIAKSQTYGPKEITANVLDSITNNVEKKIAPFKHTLIDEGVLQEEIEFTIDTFRINQIAARRIDIDYSTSGMNITISLLTKSYDSLMNKYYNKLLLKLKSEDKKVLIDAQKAWLEFNKNEVKLIYTLNKREYTGGGSMYSTIRIGMYLETVKRRTFQLFDYYNMLINNPI